MRFPGHGLPPSDVARALEAMRRDDARWQTGRTWSLVYSAGEEHEAVLRDAYLRFFNENGLSPSAFPSLARMEREVVWAMLDLLGADPRRAGGTMASGGTESIILAVKAYRDARWVDHPNLVIPSTAHPAFVKAGELLGVRPVVVPVGPGLVADVEATAAAVDEHTILLAASAPAFPYGLVDPVPELADLATRSGVGLHVDACLGGFALPFLRSLGEPVPPFDFSVPGVTSISADLHKYGYGPKGTSTVLYADRRLRRSQFTAYTDWPGGVLASPTLLGTRPGGAIAAAWAAIHHLGADGYRALFSSLLVTTRRLRDGIVDIGDLTVLGDPPMTVFAFGSEERDIFAVADLLEARDWRIDRQSGPDCLHLIVNPTHHDVVGEFLADLAEAYHAAPRRAPGRRPSPVVYGVTSHVPTEGDVGANILDQMEDRYDRDPGTAPSPRDRPAVRDGALAVAVLESGGSAPSVPTALIEACSLPTIGSRLAYLSVRIDPELRRPFALDGSIITIRPDVATRLAPAAIALREAIELDALGAGRLEWADRILAHATALVYASTMLRRSLLCDLSDTDREGLLAPGVSVDDLDARPLESVTGIARFLEARDRSAHPCPPQAIDIAVRALPLAFPTEVLLVRGGDDRQQIDWVRGVNSYGISPRMAPWIVALGSCTASSPTFRAFDAARHLRHRLLDAARADRLDFAIEAETEVIRATILAALGVDPELGCEVVLTPSGTDAELIALAVSLAAGIPVRTVMVAPVEVGRGSTPAAAGRHFTSSLPSGRTAVPGEAVAGIDPDRVEMVKVPVRDDDGTLLAPEEVEQGIDRAIATAPHRVLVHVVEGSKTGIRLPRSSVVSTWEEREGPRLDVVVDAAQMRIDQQTVVAHLERGRMIFVTGSKFFGGPPFSGAVLIPRHLADRVRAATDLPAGLADYLTRSDVPDSLPSLRAVVDPGANFGLLVRWEAALAEMRAFHNASPEIRDEILRVLAAGVRRILETRPQVAIVESPYSGIPAEDHRGLDELPTIFTFLVRHPAGGYLDEDQAKRVHHLLGRDVAELLGVDGDSHPVASRSFHLGQPVKIARVGDRWTAGLRIAVGAVTISQVVFDHTRGERWTDRIDRELADVKDALAKLALILERIDLGDRLRPAD